MSRIRSDDILNINVGGKRFTVCRKDLLVVPQSRLADWFRPNAGRSAPIDKGGNLFVDRDPNTFRYIVTYLRFKRDGFAPILALPSQPDDLAKLVGECEALQLTELKELALKMLKEYAKNEEQHFVTSFVQTTMHELESWQFDRDQSQVVKKSNKESTTKGTSETIINGSAYDDW